MKGIEYTAENVLKIMRRLKWQTRRPIKFPKHIIETPGAVCEDGGGNWVAWSPGNHVGLAEFTKKAYPNGEGFPCKYGKAGDHLYVKEELRRTIVAGVPLVVYAADRVMVPNNGDNGGDFAMWKWKPNMLPPRYMPAWASRLTLEITNVRAQRLQDITEEDALAEGVRTMEGGSFIGREGPGNWVTPWPTARDAFFDKWDGLYGHNAWRINSWVWAITFKLVE